jgi:hypothetical protein
MPYTCVKTADLSALDRALKAYGRISTENAVRQAAHKAGDHLKEAMQKTIRGESTLRSFEDVAQGITVWDEPKNVVVGIPPTSPLISRAWQMHGIYPVKDVVSDLTRQQGDTEGAFYDALAEIMSQ